MNREAFSNVAIVALALCAITTTSLVVKREMFPSGPGATAPPLTRVDGWQDLARDGTMLYGPSDALVTVLAFSDFQCPACKQLSTVLARLRDAHPGRVRVVLRHFPLEAIHPFAFEAALAAECANDVGGFARMEEQLYKNQSTIAPDRWGTFAAEAGVADTLKLTKCVRDSLHVARIRSDVEAGDRLRVTGTPTVLVNELRINGAASYQLLDSLTRAQINIRAAVR